jgi:hypothetical protein
MSIIGIMITTLPYLIQREVAFIGLPIGLILFSAGYKKLYSVVYPLILMLIYFEATLLKVGTPYLKYIIPLLLTFNIIYVFVSKKTFKIYDLTFTIMLILLWILNIVWNQLNLSELINRRILILTIILTIIIYGILKLYKTNSSINKILLGSAICLLLISHLFFNISKMFENIDLYLAMYIFKITSLVLINIWICISALYQLTKKKN